MSTQTLANRRPTIVSFSGIDGAGKSTQIETLRARLNEAGLNVWVLAFWDDVAVLGRMREFSSHTLFKSERGVGSPEKPVNRQDKNVTSWYMTPARLFLYLLDAIRLRMLVTRTPRTDADVVIFDRYLYDELANLQLRRRFTRIYVRLLLKLAPQPDVAYVLDADPAQARARKPEYPLEFLHSNRASYLRLSALAGMTVIDPLPTSDVAHKVMTETLKKLTPRQRETASNTPSENLITAG